MIPPVSVTTRRARTVPEVVQTSAMDCGPAALKSLLEGFGIAVSYGRLREACQTAVDGTSIDTLETVAGQLGLVAEQIMVPADHLLLPAAAALPALVVLRLPNGLTHFVVVWQRWGRFVQVMDPATGRRWLPARRLLDELHIHTQVVPAAAWREWAATDEALRPLGRRLAATGVPAATVRDWLAQALADPGPQRLAGLDAATRMVTALVRSGGVRRGPEAVAVLERFRQAGSGDAIPSSYWSVQPAPPDADGDAQLSLRGAVLVRVRGRRSTGSTAPPDALPLPPELAAALAEPRSRAGRTLLDLLRADGLLLPAAVLLGIVLAVAGGLLQALLLRDLLTAEPAADPVAALGRLIGLAVLLVALNGALLAGVQRLGRRLEARLRAAFAAKLPRLGDRYFSSRPLSDMAERSHSVHLLRAVPTWGAGVVRAGVGVLATAAGLVWLDPAGAPLAIAVAGVALLVPTAGGAALAGPTLRVRTHLGALGRFYLDALLGLVAIRLHGAERALRGEHEALLGEWARAGRSLLRAGVAVEALVGGMNLVLITALLATHLARTGLDPNALLYVYWALNLPLLGSELALLARQYPTLRTVTLRLLEPLGAAEEGAANDTPSLPLVSTPTQPPGGGAVRFAAVTVVAGGQPILTDLNLEIAAGSHVAIVGPSGAGKSSLVGLLLGWHRPVSGAVWVDGAPLAGARLDTLRQTTAWVDPTVQLWNQSLAANLRYGSPADGPPLAALIAAAELETVLARLPAGLETPLGDGGALVAGGEGQRVRFGRALGRAAARLVILDEPFRGLDHARRAALLAQARRYWPTATLLCVTHDIAETAGFDRVLVVEAGRIVEDGAPALLAAAADSRYNALLRAEQAVRAELWAAAGWRRLRLEDGRLIAVAAQREETRA
ncbi:MAG: cysteine peptidase family C39 domain-containing protein [Chloroflexota bacterium]|nr:cysteine peptidase family C39 domain-containing protein [Chloroflexota bacterium]